MVVCFGGCGWWCRWRWCRWRGGDGGGGRRFGGGVGSGVEGGRRTSGDCTAESNVAGEEESVGVVGFERCGGVVEVAAGGRGLVLVIEQ